MYAPSVSPPAITPNGDGVADTIRFSARFAHTVNWRAAVQDSGGRTLASTSGTANSMSMTWNGKVGTSVLPQDVYQFVINASNAHGTMRTAIAHFNLWRFPDGTLLRSSSSGWAGILQSGRLGHLVSLAGLQSRYRDAETIWVSEAIRSAYPAGPDLGFREGSVVRVTSSTWVISDGLRRPISDAAFSALRYNPGSVIYTTSAGLTPTPQGSDVAITGGYPNGTALTSTDGREALQLSGLARPFITSNVRQSYAIRDVDLVGPADTQVSQGQTNPPVGFRDGTLVQAVGTPTVYVVSNGLRRRFASMHQLGVMGYKTANIRMITAAELALNPEGTPL
jgi:gliding motility-associated-like protein